MLPLPASLIPQTNQKIGESGKSIYFMIRDYTANTNNKIDCFELGRQLGLFISETLEAKVDSYVPLVEAQKLQ